MSSSSPLHRYIVPKLDESRRARQFERISARVRRERRPWRRLAMPVAAIAVAALLALAVSTSRSTSVAPADAPAKIVVLESGSATLADGSRVALGASSRLVVAVVTTRAIRLELERGRVDVDASHDPARSFVVAAAGYEVHVVGTRFRVEREGEHGISVSVEQGRVAVKKSGSVEALQMLGPGETWSASLRTAAAVPAPEQERTSELAEPPNAPAPTPSAAQKPAASVPSAKQLFERAQAARAKGRLDEARAAFSALRQHHPNDPRASLAAFELARIELDTKGDARRAAKALDEAIASSPPGAPLREDAEARRVEAVEATGDHAACVVLRDAYLARYPKGVHRAQVASRCKKR